MDFHDECCCHKCFNGVFVQNGGFILLCPQCRAWRLSARGYLFVGGCFGIIAVLLGIVWSITHFNSTYSYIHSLYLMLIGITSAKALRFMERACESSDRFGSEIIRTGRSILFMEIVYVGLAFLFMLV